MNFMSLNFLLYLSSNSFLREISMFFNKIIFASVTSPFSSSSHFKGGLISKKSSVARVSVQGVKSLGGHFACLWREPYPGREFEFYEVRKIFVIIFQKENGNTFTLLIIFIVKSLKKEQNSTNLLICPQSARINLQSPQSDSTPWTLMTFPLHQLKPNSKTQ